MVDGSFAPVIVAGVMANGNTSALVSEIAFLERAKSSPKKKLLSNMARENRGNPCFGAIGDLF